MNNHIKHLKVGLAAAGVVCALYASGVLIFFTPLPVYYVALVYGRRPAYLALAVSFVLVALFYLFGLPHLSGMGDANSWANIVNALPGSGLSEGFGNRSVVFFGLLNLAYFLSFGCLFAEASARKWNLSKTFAVAAVVPYLMLVAACGALEFCGVDVLFQARQLMHGMLSGVIAAQEASGAGGERLFMLKSEAGEIVNYSIAIAPAIVFLLGLLFAVINHAFVRRLVKIPDRFKHLGDVRKFALPHQFVWVIIALGFAYFLEKYALPMQALHLVAINGLIVCAGVYFLQGLIIFSFYMQKLGGRFIKWLAIIAMFMFIQVVAPVAAIVGFADLWFDFRRLDRKEKDKKGAFYGSNLT